MNNFDFYNPTHIVFGKDRFGDLKKLIPQNANILVLYGGGSVVKFGTLDKVKANLPSANVFEFAGIEPNPKYETLMRAVEMVKAHDINFLLAVGGGSVLDGAKFVNMAANYDGDNHVDLLYNRKLQASLKTSTPMGTILTLPATGSEMNSGGVISHNKGKHVIGNPLLFPKFSILDPSLSFTLPITQVANGIVDAFIHTVEQYVTCPTDAKFQDRTAEGILKSLIEVGKANIDNPEDYDARANLVWLASMALNGLIGAGVPQDWTTHMLGHELTAMFGIDHGKTLAILQPSVWNIRKEKKRAKLLQYAERVWDICEGTDDEKIDLAIDKTRAFFESLGIKTRLSEYDISKDKINDLVKALEDHKLTALSETGDLNLEDSRAIYTDAY